MGACVSSLHDPSSTMKLHISSTPDAAIPPSPVKEKPPIINGDVAVKPQLPPLHSTANFREFGSKEETFFDSQAWLESDCESDFMSVNGDFTPSRGNTPVNRSFSTATPPMNGGASAVDEHNPSMTVTEQTTSPVKKSKRLSELFCESQRENHNCDEENGESADGNGVVGSVEETVVRDVVLKPKRESWVEVVGVHGCLPRVLSSCRPISHQQTEPRKK